MVGQMYSVEFTEEDFKLFDLAEDAIDCLFYSLEEEVGEASEIWDGNITNVEVEADNEIEAELKALDEFHFTFDSCRVAGVDCLDDED